MNSKRVKHFLSPFTGLMPAEKLRPFLGHRFIFPFWHAVSDTPPPHLSQLYSIPTTSGFEHDLDFFLTNYNPAAIEDVCRLAIQGEKTGENYFFPTFDDGLAECYSVIAPILKKKGIQAAFFINPSFVDNQSLFHRHKASLILHFLSSQRSKPAEIKEAEQLLKQEKGYKSPFRFLHDSVFTDHLLLDRLAAVFRIDFNQYLARQQPYMTLGQIRELQDDGFLIGAHGMDHREFFLTSEDEIVNQISSGMEYLNQNINPPLKLFAFPFTDFKVPDSVFEKASQSKTWDLSFGTAGIKDEMMQNHIQRIPMESGRIRNGKQVIRTEYISYLIKSLLGKNKVRRQ